MDRLTEVNITSEIEKSFLDYSMSVIVQRALPDLRDGLKPVHRRILYTMHEDGLTPDKAFRKSATTVGAVIGRYHPHGDTAVYDSLVRMAQDFNYRYVLIDGHGNFGSIDGYEAAAYRYTEARLSKMSMELLKDINKDTVDFVDNFDGSLKEPAVLPSRFPNILVNGTMGIAVGMATNIPPHNLGEILDGCIAYIDNNDITLPELMTYVKGPDFPTGATILGNSGIIKAYETGKGTITIRSKAEIVEHNNKSEIVVTEIPYTVNKLTLKERIAELVRDKVLEGITDLRDESTITDGIKIVLEVKKEANANVVLNNLYKHTQLQTNYGINLLMLDEGQPKTLGLKDIISKYVNHQKSVIYRRTKFDLDKAEKRAHILEGLKIALDHIDAVIKTIREATNDDAAKEQLISKFSLSVVQAEAILEMKLRRLTGLERKKIEEELSSLMELIANLKEILACEQKILDIIKNEMIDIKNKYSDPRKTAIDMSAIDYIEDESLIPEEKIMITMTNKGYIKRLLVDTYRTQNRGGVGIKGITTNEEDFVEQILLMQTHDYIMFFTNKGKVYRMKGYEIPEYSRQSKGLPIVNLLPLDKDENVSAIITVEREEENSYLLFATRNGLIKRCRMSDFESIRANGKIAITLNESDELIAVKKTNGTKEVLLASTDGRMARFSESEIRVTGRTAAGVRGINLGDAKCIGAEIVEANEYILVVTEKGYGKRTPISEYRLTHRGSKGVKTINITEKNGTIVSVKSLLGDEDIIIMSTNGIVIRLSSEQISVMSRVTQGVRLITLKDDQKVSTVAKATKEPEEFEENDEEVPRETSEE